MRHTAPPLRIRISSKGDEMRKREGKLQINRETLRNLNNETLRQANGGVAWTGCDSACTECGGGIGKTFQPAEPVLIGGFDRVAY